jgi:hypothetical protein
MKLWKHTLITAFAFFGIAGTVFYTSCEKDSCNDLRCRNGGSCVEGFCRCPEGYEGAECEILAGTKFIGEFLGHVDCGVSPVVDTVEIWMTEAPKTLKLVQHSRITDTLVGVTEGAFLKVPTVENGNYRKSFNINVDGTRLSYYFEEIFDVTNASQGSNKCTFIGFN